MSEFDGWGAFLINLPENIVRRKKAELQLDRSEISYSFVNSVNGLQMKKAEIDAVYCSKLNYIHCKASLTPQEIGCYLSHRSAWIQFLSSPLEYALILEDDFLIPNPETVKSTIESLAPHKVRLSWDIIKLFMLKRPNPSFVSRILSDYTLIRSLKVPTCMTGYLISRTGAHKLLGSRSKVFRPVDEDIKYYWEFGIKVYSIHPPLISLGEQYAELGTVGAARREHKKSGLTGRKVWIQLKYQLRIAIELFLQILRRTSNLLNHHEFND